MERSPGQLKQNPGLTGTMFLVTRAMVDVTFHPGPPPPAASGIYSSRSQNISASYGVCTDSIQLLNGSIRTLTGRVLTIYRSYTGSMRTLYRSSTDLIQSYTHFNSNKNMRIRGVGLIFCFRKCSDNPLKKISKKSDKAHKKNMGLCRVA